MATPPARKDLVSQRTAGVSACPGLCSQHPKSGAWTPREKGAPCTPISCPTTRLCDHKNLVGDAGGGDRPAGPLGGRGESGSPPGGQRLPSARRRRVPAPGDQGHPPPAGGSRSFPLRRHSTCATQVSAALTPTAVGPCCEPLLSCSRLDIVPGRWALRSHRESGPCRSRAHRSGHALPVSAPPLHIGPAPPRPRLHLGSAPPLHVGPASARPRPHLGSAPPPPRLGPALP